MFNPWTRDILESTEIQGRLKGVCLDQVPTVKDYWFDWRNYNPDTTVYGIRHPIQSRHWVRFAKTAHSPLRLNFRANPADKFRGAPSMSKRYKVRVYESGNNDSSVAPGTNMTLTDQTFTIYAYTGDEAEQALRKNVVARQLPTGRVYQLCPAVGNPEVTRTIAVSLDGTFERVFLDPAYGLYSQYRRVRSAESNQTSQPKASEPSLLLR